MKKAGTSPTFSQTPFVRCHYIRGQRQGAYMLSGAEVLGRALAVAPVLHDVESDLLTLDKSVHAGTFNG
jgi:hypothetical protein